jgi:hypothetical protein
MNKGERLLTRMRATKAGWGQRDFEELYTSFGFVYEEGGLHRLYYHPRHPHLRTTVGRHNDLAKGYAAKAVRLIDELNRLEGEDE